VIDTVSTISSDETDWDDDADTDGDAEFEML
jgi:hypothetical protein